MEIKDIDFEKIKYLSRIYDIEKNLMNDFINILNFVENISKYSENLNNNHSFSNRDDSSVKNEKIITFENLREDNVIKFDKRNLILKNFYNIEDDFCVVPIVIEK